MTAGSNELLAHLIRVQSGDTPLPIDVLHSIKRSPQGPTALADACSVSRKTIYNSLSPLADRYIVVREEDEYELTGYGAVLLRALEAAQAASSLDRSAVRFLASSENRVIILKKLRDNPTKKASLANSEDTPSRTTIHRAIETFIEKNWVREDSDGRYELTTTGEHVLTTYTELTDAIHIAEAQSEFLYCCDETVADIPLDALAGAELYVNTPEAPDTTRGVLRELVGPDLDRFKGFLSTVSTASADVGDSIIRAGTQTELIVPERVLYNLPTEGHYATHVKRGLEAQNFDLLVVSDIDCLPIGLAIFDDETVFMGPADFQQIPDGGNAGTIVSSNPALVAWANSLYRDYRDRAQTPARHVLRHLWEKVTDRTPLVNSRDSNEK